MHKASYTCATIVLVMLTAVYGGAQAQSELPAPSTTPLLPPKFEPPIRLPAELVGFFAGEWRGEGEFASGKKIEADASFTPDLDDQWLIYRHRDHAPNRYQALGMWGYESASKAFVMVVNDNFGGSRLFSSEGWKDGRIIFCRVATITPPTETRSGPPVFQERFTFDRQSEDTFKMTYESSKDGSHWRLGDYLVFKKEPKT